MDSCAVTTVLRMPLAQESDLPPVPDDETPTQVSTQLPWSQIPKFVPGTTNVQEYTQKLKFLAALWPTDFLDQLAPRAALLVEGTAFKKIARIPPQKLKVKSTDGIAAIVEAIGGSWGSTELEERHEFFEKSLYGTVQRSDESHDRFLSRMEANFVELIARNTTLEEVQAYVLLRQSTLNADDKKRILLEHGGELKYGPVVKAFRLLGSRFFNEFQTGRSSQKNKVYDVNVSEADQHEHHTTADTGHHERAFFTHADEHEVELEPDFIEALIAQDDADALTVSTFEGEFEDFLQETPEMYEALTSYIEARSKLVEKRKSRGFWPVKGKGKSFKGRGKSFGKRSKDREALLQRISKSHCRRCGALGHWKAECPQASQTEKSAMPSSSATAHVVIDERPHEIFHASDDADEVISEEEYELPSVDASPHPVVDEESCFVLNHDNRAAGVAKLSRRMFEFNMIRQKFNTVSNASAAMTCPRLLPRKCPDDEESHHATVQSKCRPFAGSRTAEAVYSSLEDFCTHAILDTGASRCIIGDKTLHRLKQSLPECIRSQIRQKDSSVKFRFGNNQSLTSMYAVQLPLKHVHGRKLWLSVEVVRGLTPFLFSKKAFKMLQGSLDTQTDQCVLSKVQEQPIPLQTSPTGLYLIDMLDICQGNATAFTHTEVKQCFSGRSHSQFGVNCSNGDKLELPKDKQFLGSVVGVSQLMQDPATSAKRFLRVRDFRSKDQVPPFPQHSTADCHHAANGQCPQDHCRSPDPASHHAVADPSATARETGNPCRDGDGKRAGGSCSPAGYDAPDSATGRHTGSPPRGGGSAKEDSRKEGETSACSRPDECGLTDIRKFHSTVEATDSQCQSAKESGTVRCFPSCKLARDRSRGRDHLGSRDGPVCSIGTEPRTSLGATCTNLATAWKPDDLRVGNQHDQFWQKTQRENLLRSDGEGSRLPAVEFGSLRVPHAGAPRFLPIRSALADTQPQRDLDGRDAEPALLSESEGFHVAVQATRDMLKQPTKFQDTSQIHAQIEQTIHTMEDLLFTEISNKTNHQRIFLLEVYANQHSPLTESVQRMGLKAIRFTKEDGNLATFAGRQRLWDVIEKYQPEHIWMAPECGPWGGWNHLNKFKSVQLYDAIQAKQDSQLPHVRLCAKICKFQVRNGRHFHLEQPAGSGLPHLKIFESLRQETATARFDMCRFGLRIPKTNKYLRKRSVLLTSSKQMFHAVHDQRCTNQHDHQNIEGSISVNGNRQRLTSFCATYCRGFADMMARNLCKNHHSHVGSDEHAISYHADGEEEELERPAKRPRHEPGRFKRRRVSQVQPVEVHDVAVPDIPISGHESVDPNPETNVSGPLAPTTSRSEPWKNVLDAARPFAPRVGNARCPTDSTACN